MAEQEKSTPAVKKQTDKPAKAKKPSFFARIGNWFHELKAEIKKIVWPTLKPVSYTHLDVYKRQGDTCRIQVVTEKGGKGHLLG